MATLKIRRLTRAQYEAIRHTLAEDELVQFTDAAPGQAQFAIQETEIADTASVQAVTQAGAIIPNWQPSTAYGTNIVVRATVTVASAGIEAGDPIRRRSTAGPTSGTTFDATEAADWEELGAQVVKTVASAAPDAAGNVALGGAATLNVGTAAGTVAAGNDARLSDARPPTSHTHAQSDVTDLDTALNRGKLVTIHVANTDLAITEALHSNAEIHLEGTGNLTIAAAAVTTDTFGCRVVNTDAGADRTLTPSGFTGAFIRDGVTTAPFAALTIRDNESYDLTVTINGADKYLNAFPAGGTRLKTVNGTSIVGIGNVTVAADLPGGAPAVATNDGLATTGSPTSTTVGADTALTFNANGTFTVPLNVSSARVLVVGGGGGGGGAHAGGGGGAGRVIENPALALTPGQTYAITIGAGGTAAGGTGAGATAGGDSSIGAIAIANGGGRGGSSEGQPASTQGGSGGGGSGGNNTSSKAGSTAIAGASTGGSPTATGVGNAGGTTAVAAATYTTGSGGGGAGGAGTPSTGGSGSPGAGGGAGVNSDITGSVVGYGGGGGGGGWGSTGGVATHGAGSGGSLASPSGAAAAANRGGGGGGSNADATNGARTGGAGGSGVVVVRFASTTRSYQSLQSYADDTAAKAAGRLVGQFYLDSSTGAVRQVQ